MTLWASMAPVDGTPVTGYYLSAGSLPGKAFGPEGLGWWSPALPVVGGAALDLSLWMKLDDVQPNSADGGAVVYAEWSDWNGQNKSRGYLVGGEGGAAPEHPELTRGTKGWTEVRGTVKAPENARRFALFLGARNCTGQVAFDEVDTISVRPGKTPPPAGPTAKKGDLPLVDPGSLSFFQVDLSKVVNRALADEQADDGKGGWTDQGPGYDMNGLETGMQTVRGVPFRLLSPLSCVVLDSFRRPQSTLPKSVVVPVGRKADVLYILHSGAWLTPGKRHWTYIARYADGKSESIPVVAGVNVRDWSNANVADFENTKTMRTSVWPQFVGNALSPTCGIYEMEWLNPRPAVVIDEIQMVAAEQGGVPVLLAITVGQKK